MTHFTQANLLAAKQNETGAVYHYEQALSLDPDFKDALNMLRNLKCYTKFHKTAISNANKVSFAFGITSDVQVRTHVTVWC